MYSSDPSLGLALHHHHPGVEAQVEYEALWVLVWVGCHCTGHLFPTLGEKTGQELIDDITSKSGKIRDNVFMECFSFRKRVWTWERQVVSAQWCPPCLMTLLGPLGCWGGGGGGGGGEPWSCPCERSAVPYTATVRLVYQPRSTRPSVFTCTHKRN